MKIRHKKYLSKFTGYEGKTAVITGASGAIGKLIAINFLMLGMKVILPVLKAEEADDLKNQLAEHFDLSKIQTYPIDLCDENSIKSFVETVKGTNINYLINNAGVIGQRDYAVNFKGTLNLTLAMTPILNKSVDSCVVFQSSLSYRNAKIDWNNPKLIYKKSLQSYARTKRLLNLAVVWLKNNYLKQFPNVKYEIAHPGCVISDIMGKVGKLSKTLAKPFFHSPQTAALSATIAAIIPVKTGMLVGPKVFGIWGKPKFRKLDKRLFKTEELSYIESFLKKEFSL